MPELALTIVSTFEALLEVERDLASDDVTLSAIDPLDSAVDGLDASLSPEDIEAVAGAIVAVMKAGTATLELLEKLRTVVRRRGDDIEVRDAKTGRRKGFITTSTSDDELAAMAKA